MYLYLHQPSVYEMRFNYFFFYSVFQFRVGASFVQKKAIVLLLLYLEMDIDFSFQNTHISIVVFLKTLLQAYQRIQSCCVIPYMQILVKQLSYVVHTHHMIFNHSGVVHQTSQYYLLEQKSILPWEIIIDYNYTVTMTTGN